jgi:PleD family two-component response regulator
VADWESGDGATDLIRRADERLYESKRSGKNRYTA